MVSLPHSRAERHVLSAEGWMHVENTRISNCKRHWRITGAVSHLLGYAQVLRILGNHGHRSGKLQHGLELFWRRELLSGWLNKRLVLWTKYTNGICLARFGLGSIVHITFSESAKKSLSCRLSGENRWEPIRRSQTCTRHVLTKAVAPSKGFLR